MQKSQRLGATLFALSTLLILQGTLPANAQDSQKVKPAFDVASAAHKGIFGYTPDQIKRAYGFDQIKNSNAGLGQVIAIVEAFDDPQIQNDLAVFNQIFNLPQLPPCTAQNPDKCFAKVFAPTSASSSICLAKPSQGSNPGPAGGNPIWSLETALDVEWAHAIAPKAKILLVEAQSDQLKDLLAGVDLAISLNASTISMSWGLPEANVSAEIADDCHFMHAKVTFFAAAGDSGHGVLFPAASPYVMGVGGTTLKLDDAGNYQSEKAWSGSGGGISIIESEPIYQVAYPISNDTPHRRGTPDVAYLANPNTGVAIYDSVPFTDGSSGWFEVGGTSAGPPQWSALVAIANSMRGSRKGPLTGSTGVDAVLYDLATDDNFNDIVKGRDGTCGTVCKTRPGYDFVTGLGTPQANNLVPDLRDLP